MKRKSKNTKKEVARKGAEYRWRKFYREALEELRKVLEENGPMLLEDVVEKTKLSKRMILKITNLNPEIFVKLFFSTASLTRKIKLSDVFDLPPKPNRRYTIIYLKNDSRIVDFFASRVRKPIDNGKCRAITFSLSRILGKFITKKIIDKVVLETTENN